MPAFFGGKFALFEFMLMLDRSLIHVEVEELQSNQDLIKDVQYTEDNAQTYHDNRAVSRGFLIPVYRFGRPNSRQKKKYK